MKFTQKFHLYSYKIGIKKGFGVNGGGFCHFWSIFPLKFVILLIYIFSDDWMYEYLSDNELLDIDIENQVSHNTVNSTEELLEYVNSNRSIATTKKTNQIFSRFFKWLGNRNSCLEGDDLDENKIKLISPEKMDTELGAWLIDLKKNDGL